MVHQWHYRRLLPPPPTARRRLPWVRRLVPTTTTLALPTTIYSAPSQCFNVAPSALVAAIATAQPRPTARRHPGSPFTAALAVRPSLGSPECAAKHEEDPYLVNIASTRRLATLPHLITLPRARRQDVKDRQGCYLLAALATFGIAFASAIADLRRPSATRPPPLTKLQITGDTGAAPHHAPPPPHTAETPLSPPRRRRRAKVCVNIQLPRWAEIRRDVRGPVFPAASPPPCSATTDVGALTPRASLSDTPPPPSPSSPNPMLNDGLCPIAAKKLSAPVPIQSQSLIPSSPFDPSHSTLPTRTGRSPNTSHEKKKKKTACTHHPIRCLKKQICPPRLELDNIQRPLGRHRMQREALPQVREVSTPLSLSLSAALATPTPKICV
ncbi:hypothetical protein B0H14DRAFT_3873119 [Mycena olivaceomarginata]|nr:hypothetical protein B0H14DRAFT_3873119 [Mycena olivaceomarginata]